MRNHRKRRIRRTRLRREIGRLTARALAGLGAAFGVFGVFGGFVLLLLSARPVAAEAARPATLKDVGIEQRMGEALPLDIELRDEAGRAVRLGDYFGKRPVVLALVYYECPMLCTLVLNGLTAALAAVPFDAGSEFEVVAVSFDPREGPALAAKKRETYVKRYGRPNAAGGAGAGWHFLTGAKPSIDALTRAVGFRYKWDAELQQFAHASGLTILTPEGRIARYLFGVEYAPRDLRLALVEASEGKVGSAVDKALLLFCYRYDPEAGKYGAVVMGAVRAGGIATILAIGTFLFVMFRRERRACRSPT